MGRRRLRVVSVIMAIVIGSWGSTSARAFAAPATVPVITAPTDSSAVSGDVAIDATSSASMVQFYADAVEIGTPVDVVATKATV